MQKIFSVQGLQAKRFHFPNNKTCCLAHTIVGVTSAPKGKQNLVEVLVAFIRDEVARPNLSHKANKKWEGDRQ